MSEKDTLDDDGTSCLICCGALACDSEAVSAANAWQLPCGHRQWHRCCVEDWLVRQQTCPVCRAHVPPSRRSEDALTDNLLDILSDASIRSADCEAIAIVRELQEAFGRQADALDQDRLLLEEVLGIERELEEQLRELQDLHELRGSTLAVALPSSFQEEVREEMIRESTEDEEACALLARVAAAVQRSGLSAGHIFCSLPQQGAPLHLEAAASLLSAFGGASAAVVARAAEALDLNRSGWVEEADFKEAMRCFVQQQESYSSSGDLLQQAVTSCC
eukprot:TRINITY_DN108355_c0_g1_i1.p1 TRINITY_DN108355_c0_g1~~TRINITY_DN108355_c0_g1_i1.p1  ORF type:complete len:283 (-),score=88.47 TRINITY_DN108355_c0_g1_i1:52-879(-)